MGRFSLVSPEHLDALCDELKAVVEDAAASGNEVFETWTDFGNGVLLEKSRPVLDGVSADVKAQPIYESLRDPHSWLGEIRCRTHPGWFVALAFEGPKALEPKLPSR